MLDAWRIDLLGSPDAARGSLARTLGRELASPAEQFASWLPYCAYIADESIFVNRDSIGFLLELMPQSGADERIVEVLGSLYATCPPGTGVQFHLFASPHVREPLRRYANLRVEDADQSDKAAQWGRPARNDNLFRRLARQRVAHLLLGAQRSMTAGFHYTIRDFRLLLSVTFPAEASDVRQRDELLALRAGMSTTLNSASLPNRVCDAADLINWCALFTNPDRLDRSDAPDLHYDDGRELRDQIVDFDTVQEASAQGLRLCKQGASTALEARFYSIKSFPEHYALWQMGSLIGDLMQPALQYSAPFLITMGAHLLDPNETKAAVTANHVRATQNARSPMARVMPDVGKKLKDWSAAADAVDVGGTLLSLYHQIAIFTPAERAASAEEAAKAI
jgi:conjugal transfer ATP-binding protein TraC